jgi:hypothetical protein
LFSFHLAQNLTTIDGLTSLTHADQSAQRAGQSLEVCQLRFNAMQFSFCLPLHVATTRPAIHSEAE